MIRDEFTVPINHWLVELTADDLVIPAPPDERKGVLVVEMFRINIIVSLLAR